MNEFYTNSCKKSTATITRPANTTAYDANDVVGTAVDVDKIVTSADMKVGEYTIAAQPSVASKITVSATAGDTADTMGTITVTGTLNNIVVRDTITPVAGSTVSGTKEFDAITSVVGAGWVIDAAEGTNDTITVGVDATNLIFTDIGMENECIKIVSVSLNIALAAVTANMTTFKLHLYDASPTAIADNSAFTVLDADKAKYLGAIDISQIVDVGGTLFIRDDGKSFVCKLSSTSSSLYGVLQTIGNYTPTSAEAYSITVYAQKV